MSTFDPDEEPTETLARFEFWRQYLDQMPEFWPLTRSAQQYWSLTEFLRAVQGFPSKVLRRAFQAGEIAGAHNVRGQRGVVMPRSSLIVVLGRIISGKLRF